MSDSVHVLEAFRVAWEETHTFKGTVLARSAEDAKELTLNGEVDGSCTDTDYNGVVEVKPLLEHLAEEDKFECTNCEGIKDIEESVKLGGKKSPMFCIQCADNFNDWGLSARLD